MATGLVISMAFGFLLVFFPQLSFIEREPLLNIILLMFLGINAGLISALISNPEIDIEHTKATPRRGSIDRLKARKANKRKTKTGKNHRWRYSN